MNKKTGFTLIELLIVVAIIAILAAIAVPNFLEAQTRSKIARVRSDMRTVATAVEVYGVDRNNKYPFSLGAAEDLDGYGQLRQYAFLTIPDALTTPIAYLTSHVPDQFKVGASADIGPNQGKPFNSGDPQDMTFMWLAMDQAGPNPGDPGLAFGFFNTAASWNTHFAQWGKWRVSSVGPMKAYPGSTNYPLATFVSVNSIYDASNGTVSLGMIHRNQRSTEGDQK